MVFNRIFLFLISVLTFALSAITFAQTQKHDVMIGGNGSFSKRYRHFVHPNNSSPDGTVTNTFNLNPTVSYFIVNNLALGISGNFRSYKTLDTEDGNNLGDGHSYSLGPIIRYYFPFHKWAIFPEAQLLKVFGKSHSYIFDDRLTSSTTGSAYKLGVGGAYFVTPNVGLEGLLSYSSESTSRHDNFYIGSPDAKIKRSGINLSIGIQFYLSRLSKNN